MANENDDVLDANQGGPAADIPDLKKKEKERKKAGAAWSGARVGGGPFSGATGGTVARAAASAAGSAAAEGAAAGAAEAGAGLWASVMEYLTDLTATMMGRLALGLGSLLLVGGAGLLGWSLLGGGGGAGGGVGSPNLGGITDSLKIHRDSGDRVDVASKGEIRFDPVAKAKPAPKPEEKKIEDAPPPAEATHIDDSRPGFQPENRLAHNLSGAKLSSSLGGGFGNKDIFAGNSAAPKFGQGLPGGAKMPNLKTPTAKMSAMAGAAKGTATARSIGKARTSRAIGQLKMAKGMSTLAAGAGATENAAAAANGAFDQSNTQGGQLIVPGDKTGTANTLGQGAPDTSMPSAPGTPGSTATDQNLQNQMDQINQMAQQAGQLQQMGLMMLAIGMMLIAVGASLLGDPLTMGFGIALIAIGSMLVGMGIMMMQMAAMLAAMAKAMGQNVAKQVGPYQGKVVNYCTDQAIAGTPPQNCTPPDSMTQGQQFDAQDKSAMQRQRHIADDAPVITYGAASGGSGSLSGSTGGTDPKAK